MEVKYFELPGYRPGNAGSKTKVLYAGALEQALFETYGRRDLCLKVFKHGIRLPSLEGDRWGSGVSFMEAAKIQNLCALYGKAPRIYDIVKVKYEGSKEGGERMCYAQVTDFVQGSYPEETPPPPDLEAVRELVGLNQYLGSADRKDWIDGQLLDFEKLRFAKRGADQFVSKEDRIPYIDSGASYLAELRERIPKVRKYQAVPELDIQGRRDMAYRVEKMRLDEIDFEGKTVLDIGCNLGAFCRYAWDRGAKRVVGIDAVTAQWAAEIANWLEYWNLDFFQLAVPQDGPEKIAELSGIESFDIVFLLAMIRRVSGWAPWLSNCCKEVMYLESHHTDDPEKKIEGLTRNLSPSFDRIEDLGLITDDRKRVLLRCWK